MQAKMQAVADLCQPLVSLVPYAHLSCDDDLMSSVWLKCSFDKKEEWEYGIYHNSKYFMIRIIPPNGARYYSEGNVTAELSSGSKVAKFRKYTSTPEKVIAKIREWIVSQTSA